MTAIIIRDDDLSGAETRALLALHLSGMHETSPPEHVHALDLSGLLVPEITVWTARRNGAVAGVGALKMLGADWAEIKSMRTHPDHLRQGVGAAILDHVMEEARRRGVRRLSLETGSGEAFEAAIALYLTRGFVFGEPFADYEASPFNQFMHLDL
jgi:putative acetyltransferase